MSSEENPVAALKSRAGDLRKRLSFSDASQEAERIKDQIPKLSERHQKVRQGGYVFAADLDEQMEKLSGGWGRIYQKIGEKIRGEQKRLEGEVKEVEAALKRASMGPVGGAIVKKIESELADAEQKIVAAESDLTSFYESSQKAISPISSQLNRIEWYLKQKDEAGFDFEGDENLYQVAEAEWVETGSGKDDPDGFMYVTDQRVIFEQKEKVGKKFGLFGGKEVQEVEWAFQLSQIEEIEPEDKGLLGGKDLVHLTLSGAEYGKVTIEVKGGIDSKVWADHIQRAVSGDINNERVS